VTRAHVPRQVDYGEFVAWWKEGHNQDSGSLRGRLLSGGRGGPPEQHFLCLRSSLFLFKWRVV
jgi:hypothetical protein